MSPLSTGVLGAATLVSSPALWLGLVDRTLPLDVALTRYLVALVVCWAALSLVASWAFPDPRSVKVERAEIEEVAEPVDAETQ
ncbi:MAG: hypothetical protein JF565_07315 [Propionibacteriales bacterium]|nr:hypothetical protein [Propionibacteriales bacterium]